jgi:tetratricopeptide (TPR) repeat protein
MSTSETEAKPRFLERLATILQKGRLILLVLLIAILAGVIAYFVWTEVQNGAREKSALWVEKAQDLQEQWVGEADAAKKQALEQELSELLARILSKYPRQYAAQRAYLLQADMAYRAKDWGKAAGSYRALADRFPKSYLAPLSLMYAGVSYEETGDAKLALSSYQRVQDRYKGSYLVPRALFSAGRLLETDGDFTGALKAYNRLEDDHPDSNWTKAGRNRIIELKIEGKIPE